MAGSPRLGRVPRVQRGSGDRRGGERFRRHQAVEEVLVVDNNSGDHTAAQAEAAGGRVVREARQGYGNDLRRGLAEAQGEYVVLAEPDGTFMGKDVLKRLAYATTLIWWWAHAPPAR